ncbi:MAG: TM2 domain-containing protein [Nitrosopumilus sp.]|nr:TM2 domain-containing protein [Nitrosopumilus sp.]
MTLLDDVNELLKQNIGDSARLEHIKSSIEDNKPLYDSDKNYLKELSKKLETTENTSETSDDNPYVNPKTNDEPEPKNLGVEEKLKIAEEKIDKLTHDAKNQEEIEYRKNYYKSEGTTLVLAVVLGILGINGVGHIYVGKIGKGVWILIGSLILLAIGIATVVFMVGYALIFVYILIWIWQIIDSKRICKEYNDYLRQTGKTLW